MVPRTFISYSWDDEAHRAWVKSLGERLVLNGVNARLDQWHVSPGESLTQFMEHEVSESDKVLVVCTPLYAQRSLQRAGGVGYEQQMITGQIAAGVPRNKFIPILRRGTFVPGPECGIPAQFAGILALDMTSAAREEAAFEQLLRAVFGRPPMDVPALAEPPAFLTVPLRLAHMETEGWRLESGVVRNEVSPDTFKIPTEEERNNVQVGQFVKLPFLFAVDPDDEETTFEGERMWVKLTGRAGPYLLGTLANQPASYSYLNEDGETYSAFDDAPLKFGSPIVFLPEHIIDIDAGE